LVLVALPFICSEGSLDPSCSSEPVLSLSLPSSSSASEEVPPRLAIELAIRDGFPSVVCDRLHPRTNPLTLKASRLRLLMSLLPLWWLLLAVALAASAALAVLPCEVSGPEITRPPSTPARSSSSDRGSKDPKLLKPVCSVSPPLL